MIGKSLGHYEIVAPLGAGGMGEVYRARDTQLHRDVAIKVLPEALAADPERFARLEREAFALAALNHPNIATIHVMHNNAAFAALTDMVTDPRYRRIMAEIGLAHTIPAGRRP